MKCNFVPKTQYLMDLHDQSKDDPENHTLSLRVEMSSGDNLLAIGADGYGEKASVNGHGWPIVVEYHEGKFRLLVWSDINDEEPTYKIDMSEAKESNRVEDDE